MKKFNLAPIHELIALMEAKGLSKLALKEGDQEVVLERPLPGSTVALSPAPTMPAVATAPSATPAAATPTKPSGHIVTAPMVGTFYRSASPEAAVYVEIGDKVKKGQTLCIIEAMKTLNHIEADKDGTISAILVENATPVEFGEPLFVVE